jgi:hypothetical protein
MRAIDPGRDAADHGDGDHEYAEAEEDADADLLAEFEVGLTKEADWYGDD